MSNARAATFGFLLTATIPAAFMTAFWYPIKLSEIISVFLGFHMYSAFMVVIVGIPTFLIVRYFWRITLHSSLIGGFINGLIVAMFFFKIGFNDVDLALTYGLLGAVSALVFWLIWKSGSTTTQVKDEI